jgi:DNA-binding LytR/AlgR family response regulator
LTIGDVKFLNLRERKSKIIISTKKYQNMISTSVYVNDKKIESQIVESIKKTTSIEVLNVLKNNMELVERLHRIPTDILFISISHRAILSMVNQPPFVILVDEPGTKREVVDDQLYFDRLTSPINELKLSNVLGKIFRIASIYKVSKKETNSMVSEREIGYHTGEPACNEEYMFLTQGKRSFKIIHNEVLSIINTGAILQIKLENGDSFFYRSTLKKMIAFLPVSKYARISKTVIVNFTKIESFKNQQVYIRDDVFQVTRTYIVRLRERMRLKLS